MHVYRSPTARLRPAALAALVAVGGLALQEARAQMTLSEGAVITGGNTTTIPEGFREWVFIGAPLTPHGLNNGAAGFPEFHHVYIEPQAFRTYLSTGAFPEGTTIVKELVLLKEGHHPDGSRDEASGRGYFADRFAGIDMMVKDTAKFAGTNGWGFFNFGHHEPPYADSAEALPQDACAFCHEANATDDMVFTTFYPILGRE
jgi:hypothetical protein